MAKFDLLVEAEVTLIEYCEVTVEAENIDEAFEIAKHMFDNSKLDFMVADRSVERIHISEQ